MKLTDKHIKVEFSIGTLLLLESNLNIPLDTVLFEIEITEEIQKEIIYCGTRKNKGFTRKRVFEMYDKLSDTEKLIVDMKVNGELLDAFGVGKQQEQEVDLPEEETKTKFFSEYMRDFMFYMVGSVGVTKSDFYNSTPVEIFEIAERYKQSLEFNFKLNQLAHINAIGLTRSKKFKEINPFSTEKDTKVKKIDLEQKKQDLEFLKKVGE